jgi:thiol-disulfide isomerase/thioredoxin
MWWYKLVAHWSKRDYIEFSLFTWVLIFCVLAVFRLVQGEPLELPFMVVFSFVMIPVELLIVAVFQKYSSHVDEILDCPSFLQADFNNGQLLRSGKILVFFYADWCPFCRSAFHQLSSLSSISYKVFRVDLSDEENSLWTSLNIRRIPTIIAFDNGKEFWRREATYMIGIRKADFKEADLTVKAKVPE